jgi:hypothetical protein
LQKQWRFTHTFNFETHPNFSVQFAISQWSQDGRFLAFGTDGYGAFGSTTGIAPVLPVPNPAATCLGGFPWNPAKKYALGTLINPFSNLEGAGVNRGAFQAVAITTGISASGKQPVWPTVVGQKVVDGGVTWQYLGPGNCRGEVLIVDMSPLQ